MTHRKATDRQVRLLEFHPCVLNDLAADDAMQSLGFLPRGDDVDTGFSSAASSSAVGSVVVAQKPQINRRFHSNQAFRWTEKGGTNGD